MGEDHILFLIVEYFSQGTGPQSKYQSVFDDFTESFVIKSILNPKRSEPNIVDK